VLPGGITLRGDFYIGGTATAANQFAFQAISYGFTMSAALTFNVVTFGSTPGAACSGGTAALPVPTAGNVCFYEDTAAANLTVAGLNQNDSGLYGVRYQVMSAAVGLFADTGHWAATSS
jgi:hypothetical protein